MQDQKRQGESHVEWASYKCCLALLDNLTLEQDFQSWQTGLGMVAVGLLLVGITIAMGGC